MNIIYTYNDNETEVRPIPTLHGVKLMVRIRTENMVKVVFRQNEEPQCIARRNLLNAANVQLAVHPWARNLHYKFEMHACVPPNKPMYFLLTCAVTSTMLGPILHVLIPADASTPTVAAEHLTVMLTQEVLTPNANPQKLRLLSGLQLEYDFHNVSMPLPLPLEKEINMLVPLDGSKPVSPTNPCVGNLLLSFFHVKTVHRHRARIQQFSTINPILVPCADGSITPQQLSYLRSLRCTGFSKVFLPKPGVANMPDLNLLSMEMQRVAMPLMTSIEKPPEPIYKNPNTDTNYGYTEKPKTEIPPEPIYENPNTDTNYGYTDNNDTQFGEDDVLNDFWGSDLVLQNYGNP